MGVGLAVFVLCILIFIPIFIVSGVYFLKYRKASAKEIRNLRSISIRAQSAKARLYCFYGIVLILFYYEFWLTPLAKLLGFDDEPGIIYHLLSGVMSWDNLSDIVVYGLLLL